MLGLNPPGSFLLLSSHPSVKPKLLYVFLILSQKTSNSYPRLRVTPPLFPISKTSTLTPKITLKSFKFNKSPADEA